MKKAVLYSIFAFAAASSVWAQTTYYRYIYPYTDDPSVNAIDKPKQPATFNENLLNYKDLIWSKEVQADGKGNFPPVTQSNRERYDFRIIPTDGTEAFLNLAGGSSLEFYADMFLREKTNLVVGGNSGAAATLLFNNLTAAGSNLEFQLERLEASVTVNPTGELIVNDGRQMTFYNVKGLPEDRVHLLVDGGKFKGGMRLGNYVSNATQALDAGDNQLVKIIFQNGASFHKGRSNDPVTAVTGRSLTIFDKSIFYGYNDWDLFQRNAGDPENPTPVAPGWGGNLWYIGFTDVNYGDASGNGFAQHELTFRNGSYIYGGGAADGTPFDFMQEPDLYNMANAVGINMQGIRFNRAMSYFNLNYLGGSKMSGSEFQLGSVNSTAGSINIVVAGSDASFEGTTEIVAHRVNIATDAETGEETGRSHNWGDFRLFNSNQYTAGVAGGAAPQPIPNTSATNVTLDGFTRLRVGTFGMGNNGQIGGSSINVNFLGDKNLVEANGNFDLNGGWDNTGGLPSEAKVFANIGRNANGLTSTTNNLIKVSGEIRFFAHGNSRMELNLAGETNSIIQPNRSQVLFNNSSGMGNVWGSDSAEPIAVDSARSYSRFTISDGAYASLGRISAQLNANGDSIFEVKDGATVEINGFGVGGRSDNAGHAGGTPSFKFIVDGARVDSWGSTVNLGLNGANAMVPAADISLELKGDNSSFIVYNSMGDPNAAEPVAPSYDGFNFNGSTLAKGKFEFIMSGASGFFRAGDFNLHGELLNDDFSYAVKIGGENNHAIVNNYNITNNNSVAGSSAFEMSGKNNLWETSGSMEAQSELKGAFAFNFLMTGEGNVYKAQNFNIKNDNSTGGHLKFELEGANPENKNSFLLGTDSITMDTSTVASTTLREFLVKGNTIVERIDGSALTIKLAEYSGKIFTGGTSVFAVSGQNNEVSLHQVVIGSGAATGSLGRFEVHGNAGDIKVANALNIRGTGTDADGNRISSVDNPIAELLFAPENDAISPIQAGVDGSTAGFNFSGILTVDMTNVRSAGEPVRHVLISANGQSAANLRAALATHWTSVDEGTLILHTADWTENEVQRTAAVKFIKADERDEYRAAIEESEDGGAEFVVYYTSVVEPVFDEDVAPQASYAGTDATFTASARGTGLAYQWEYSTDGGATWIPITGANSKDLLLEAVGLEMDGYLYHCIITGTYGSGGVISNPAELTVQADVIEITTQPVRTEVYENKSATFSLVATGYQIEYQWRYSTDGGGTFDEIAGATGNSYTVENAQLALNGTRYQCVVSNAKNSQPSAAAEIVVLALPQVGNLPERYQPDTASVGVSATGHDLHYQWQKALKGTTAWTDIAGATAATMTIPSGSYAENIQFQCIVGNTSAMLNAVRSNICQPGTLEVVQWDASTMFYDGVVQTLTVNARTFATPDKAITYAWYTKASASVADWKKVPGKTNTLKVTLTAKKNGTMYKCEVRDANDLIEVQTTSDVKAKATIKTQPKATTGFNDKQVKLSIVATGYDLKYQWQVQAPDPANPKKKIWVNVVDGEGIAGAQGPELTLEDENYSLNGQSYRCLVSNVDSGTNQKASSTAKVSIRECVSVITNPVDSPDKMTGDTATFECLGGGYSPKYQWYVLLEDGLAYEPIAKATAKKLTIKKILKAYDGAKVFCRIYNAGSEADTTTATVKVVQKTEATPVYAKAAVWTGEIGRVLVNVKAEEGYTYQWYVKLKGSKTWSMAEGADASGESALENEDLALQIDSTSATNYNGASFHVTVTGKELGTSVTSKDATLTYTPRTVVVAATTNSPEAFDKADSSNPKMAAAQYKATFAIKATGMATLLYQWYVSKDGIDWEPVAGAAKASYSITVVTDEFENKYKCLVTNAGGTVESDVYTLNRLGAPLITVQPRDSESVSIGGIAKFEVGVSASTGTTKATYKWWMQKPGTTKWLGVSGGTKAVLELKITKSHVDGTLFKCVVTNATKISVETDGLAKLTIMQGDQAVSRLAMSADAGVADALEVDESIFDEVDAKVPAGGTSASKLAKGFASAAVDGMLTDSSDIEVEAGAQVELDSGLVGSQVKCTWSASYDGGATWESLEVSGPVYAFISEKSVYIKCVGSSGGASETVVFKIRVK